MNRFYLCFRRRSREYSPMKRKWCIPTSSEKSICYCKNQYVCDKFLNYLHPCKPFNLLEFPLTKWLFCGKCFANIFLSLFFLSNKFLFFFLKKHKWTPVQYLNVLYLNISTLGTYSMTGHFHQSNNANF